MRYLPHTGDEILEMLQAIGVSKIEDLFSSIPEADRLKRPLDLPPPLTEIELRHHLRGLSRRNAHGEEWASFLGAGLYSHYIPSAVSHLIQRGEFLTAYTPYQPEVSQGTLQAIFEYQTMTAEILGMEVANASMYDGSTGTAEAVLMALRINDREKILVARNLHPEYRQVLQTYLRNQSVKIVEVPYAASGQIDRKAFEALLDDQTSCLVAGYPNFFGIVEDLSDLAKKLHDRGGLLITSSPEPLALGLFQSPGEMGADIAVAEGQGFGSPMSLGGPSLGLFASRRDFVRNLPGRLVGETADQEGRRGFVLTLATREQHIRRERATSNICTNVSLCALSAAITLALWGRNGFQRLARINYQRSQDLKKRLGRLSSPFSGVTFNEFVIKLPKKSSEVLKKLKDQKILGGVEVERWYPELPQTLLICTTEMNTGEQIDRLVQVLEAA